ncbi:MAG: hypothetical protein GY941_15720 [Planctomycetes bacterium]|nr:hypothetical protein [Planctomycetota bacterium]
MKYEQCPCGEVPTDLYTTISGGSWEYVSGQCCGEWEIEYKTNGVDPTSEEGKELQRKAWNAAKRGEK